jgi:biopolymer transport protein ExbD
MRRHGSRHTLTSLSELNVTPLLDLAFVLLIIFMITAPFLAESADLIIPTSKASRDAVDPSAVFVVSVNQDLAIAVDGSPVSFADLPARLLNLHQGSPDLAVVIRAHKEIPVQEIVKIMDALKAADITRVGIVTKPES